MPHTVTIVIPCYNEASNLPRLLNRLEQVIVRLDDYHFDCLLVNDGSRDNTLDVLRELSWGRPWLTAISLTRNFGKEAALTAGLDHARGEAVIFMDADLQHPPETIEELLRRWRQGSKVVLARRLSRTHDGPVYKWLASQFYRLHNRISEIKIPTDVGDFRLIDRQVADQLRTLRENRRFMKGLFAWVGYEPDYVDYNVDARSHGTSSFNKWRAWNLALEGITSFSTVPLRLASYLGIGVFLLGLGYAVWLVVGAFLFGITTPGYVTLIAAIVMFGGIQLIGIGVLGEYIGRIYMEAKQRPPYFIEDVIRGQETETPESLPGGPTGAGKS